MTVTRLLGIAWTRGPSGVYQSQGDGRYVLRPVGGYTYAIDVNGQYQNVILELDKAKNWCEAHRHGKPS